MLDKCCNLAVMLLWHNYETNMSACTMLYHGDHSLDNCNYLCSLLYIIDLFGSKLIISQLIENTQQANEVFVMNIHFVMCTVRQRTNMENMSFYFGNGAINSGATIRLTY